MLQIAALIFQSKLFQSNPLVLTVINFFRVYAVGFRRMQARGSVAIEHRSSSISRAIMIALAFKLSIIELAASTVSDSSIRLFKAASRRSNWSICV